MNEDILDMEVINDVKTKAFVLTKCDPPLGTVLSRSLDVMSTLVDDGIGALNLVYLLDSVRRERERAEEIDLNKNDPLRTTVYGMAKALETTINSLIRQKNVKVVENQISDAVVDQDQPDTEAGAIDSSDGNEGENARVASRVAASPQSPATSGIMITAFKQEPMGPIEQPVVDVMDCSEEPLQPAQPAQDLQQGLRQPVLQNQKILQYLQPKQPVMEVDRAAASPESSENDEEDSNGEVIIISQPTLGGHKQKEVGAENKNGDGKDKHPKHYVCDVCSRAFRGKGALLDHMGTHTGNRSYPCTKCNRAFLYSDGLRKHLVRKHRVQPYSCIICAARFDKYCQLKKHWLKSGHKIETNKELMQRWTAKKGNK